MLVRRMIPAGLLAALALSVPVQAQNAPTHIAVANTAQIFNQIQEFKDLKVTWQNENRSIQATDQQKKTELENLQNSRDQFKTSSQQWNEANEKFLKAEVDYRSWATLMQLDQGRKQKLKIKEVFDEVQAATGEVAKQLGYDLVLAQQSPDLVNEIENPNETVAQFLPSVAQYNVLYASSTVDITDKVVTAMDAKYKSAGNPTPTPTK